MTGGASEDPLREKMRHKISALLDKTPANGATEPEAHAAYEKARELMQNYGIAPDEVGLEGEPAWYNRTKWQRNGSSTSRANRGRNSHFETDAVDDHTFDYSAVPVELAAKLQTIAERVRGASNKAVLDIGNALRLAKELLEHGQFVRLFSSYLRHELDMTLRSAENAMAAARFLADPKNEIFSNLPITAVYLLARRGTPEEARAFVREVLSTGKRPTVELIQAVLRTTRRGPMASAKRSADCVGGDRTLENLATIIFRYIPESELKLLVRYLATERNRPFGDLEKYVKEAIRANRFRQAA